MLPQKKVADVVVVVVGAAVVVVVVVVVGCTHVPFIQPSPPQSSINTASSLQSKFLNVWYTFPSSPQKGSPINSGKHGAGVVVVVVGAGVVVVVAGAGVVVVVVGAGVVVVVAGAGVVVVVV